MIDIICYVENSASLVAELQEKFPYMVSQPDENDEGGGKFLVTKTPTHRNEAGESIALIRGDAELLLIAEQLDSMIALGTYEDVFATSELKEIYDRVYPRPITTWTDDEGIEHIHQPPEKFGVFA